MTAKKSTKTNKPAAEQAPTQEMDTTTPDQDKTTPTAEDTAAEASTPEPAASPANQPAVDPSTDCPMGDSDCPEAGNDPGLNMTKGDQPNWPNSVSKTLESCVTSLRPIQAGLTPRQHISAIIAGGIIGGMLARTKPYETLDLHKAAETLGMCDTIVDMILHLDDPAPEAPDEQPNS